MFVPDSVFDQTCRFVAGDATALPLDAQRILVDGDDLGVRQRRLGGALMLRRSFPAMSGAAMIAHMLKCARPSVSVKPLPTSSMSGSFQWPGPAYDVEVRVLDR